MAEPRTKESGRLYRIEKIAREFHAQYERLAPQFGYETRSESAVRWSQVPPKNKNLMRAVIANLLSDGTIS